MMKQATLREEGKGILVNLKLNYFQTSALFKRTWVLGLFCCCWIGGFYCLFGEL